MHFFITNLIYGHVLLSPMSKYNEIKQKFNILYDVVIKTFTENWDSKAPSVGTLFRDYGLNHSFFRNKTFLFFRIES